MKKLLVIFFLLGSGLSFGQGIYDESVRVESANEMIVKTYNLRNSKCDYWQKYVFDDNGRAINAKYFFRRQLRAEYEFKYDENGFLSHEIQIFDANHKGEIDTILTKFILSDDKKVLFKETILSPEIIFITEYQEHIENKLPIKF
ncbi:MAG: hypothetical protein K8R31_11010 [Bacteroidales bacterium]|nr:hypothetical protein [Bacteroidales bacterium]